MTTAPSSLGTPATRSTVPAPRSALVRRPGRPRAADHRCTPRVLTHPHVVGRIVACTECGRLVGVPPQWAA